MTYEQFIRKYINLLHEAYRDEMEKDLLTVIKHYLNRRAEEIQKTYPKTEES